MVYIFVGKLLSRTRKIAFTLTHKSNNLKLGQRVALVFPNVEPVAFACAFHGCLLAGLVPVVVEVPQSSEVCYVELLIDEGLCMR